LPALAFSAAVQEAAGAEVEAEVELEEVDAAAATHGPLPVNAIEDAIACCTITGSVRVACEKF
jgi:hypothetical protein